MRVAWLLSDRTWQDYEMVLVPLAEGLKAAGCELVCLCESGGVRHVENFMPTVEYRKRWLGGVGKDTIKSLADELSSRKVNVLHALDATTGNLARGVSKIAKCPYVVQTWNRDDGKILGSHSRAAAAVALSSILKLSLVHHRFVNSERIHVVHAGVTPFHRAESMQAGKDASIVIRDSLDKFEPVANVIRAIAQLIADGYECTTFIVGTGSAERRLRRLVHDLAMDSNVTFTQELDARHFAEVSRAADIFVRVCEVGAFHLWTLLAMASGAAVLVAGDVKGEFIIDDETVRRYAQGDVGSIATQLRGMLKDRSGTESLVKRALSCVREDYSTDQMVKGVFDVYMGTKRKYR